MKISYLLLLILILVTCTKGVTLNNKKKYLSYDNFKKTYSYFYYNDDDFYCNILTPNNKLLVYMENDILVIYLREKEKRLEYLSYFRNIYLNKLDYEEQIVQLGDLVLEVKNQNKIINDIEILDFFRELLNYRNRDIGKRKFYKILEENFTKEEIFTIIELITYNWEFEYYEVSGKLLGLPKVDEINRKLREKKQLTHEEWSELEARGYVKRFKDEESSIGEEIYLLSSNKIVIVNNENQILKEVKVKDYRETEFLVYKDILYVYSDKKIYEIPLDNLDKVNVVEIEKS